MFIKRGANVNAQNSLGETPLHKAVFNNFIRLLLVELLLQNRADVNLRNAKGETALHYAVFLQRKDLVTALLKGGANANIKDERNVNPADLAFQLKYKELGKFLANSIGKGDKKKKEEEEGRGRRKKEGRKKKTLTFYVMQLCGTGWKSFLVPICFHCFSIKRCFWRNVSGSQFSMHIFSFL
jgi:ankyrin repeat protein